MADENKPPDPGAPQDPNAKEPFKPDYTGEEQGKWGGEGKAERGVAYEPPKRERGIGNRDPTPKPGETPEGPVKRTKEVGIGPIYKKKVYEDQLRTSKEGDDDKTFGELLSGKADFEAGAATYDLEKKEGDADRRQGHRQRSTRPWPVRPRRLAA